MTSISFTLNNDVVRVESDPETPLLWVVREQLQLAGSKYGCGQGLCGACTMHVDGEAVRTCILPISAVSEKAVSTIEGLGTPDDLHIVQQAWIKNNVPQCGYCQSGQIMSAVALLTEISTPTNEDIDDFMSGNICRCGTYPRIRKAIHDAAQAIATGVTLYSPAVADTEDGV